MELKPGDIVGGVYRIVAAGPRGGMAQLWRAEHRGLRTGHALKILGPEWTDNAAVWDQFIAEGHTQARHPHPHIVRVTDVVYDENLTALVMDWVTGSDLRARLQHGPVPPAQARTWILQLLDALDLVHGHGVIHRALKPANLLIDTHQQLRLTNFGIAHAAEGSGTQGGSSDYKSPEQLRDASQASPRSDLYSVGAIFFEMLTGRIATRELGFPTTLPTDLPPAFASIITTAMHPDPAQRQPSAAALSAALMATAFPAMALVEDTTEATVPAQHRPLRVGFIGLISLLIGGACGALGAWATFGDLDGDGIGGRADRCPAQPEDIDGFEDRDGCPELDNDNDGIGDNDDACPTEAEDIDGRSDQDGCPDDDDDGDGIHDDDDGCPTEAEDRDGFEDHDGCPELDNDNDGMADADDRCPLLPEDGPGWFDRDGCPDPVIAAGDDHSCALSAHGFSVCWGSSDHRSDSLSGLTALSAAADHTCGLTDQGAVQCIGQNTEGEAVDQDGPFVWLDTAERATCAITPGSTLSCWGSGAVMTGIPAAADFVRLSVGKDHACGIHRDGTVDCWGAQSHGRRRAPAGEFLSVSAGTWHTCGIRSDAEIVCWGFDGNGQAAAPGGQFIDVEATRFHSCGVRRSGQVDCWGLGFNEPDADITLPSGLVQIALGSEHGCGLTGEGEVVCWGDPSGATQPPSTRGFLYRE